MDRVTGLSVFAKVVESSSFAAAARHFGLSPAMVSKHIRALEERLGARLLNRTTRRVSPTEIGRVFYERATRILADIDDAEQEASALQATPRGLLRVNGPLSFGTRQLAPAIADYLAACPGVEIDVTLNDRVADLVEEGFDLAIRIARLADSSLIARRIAPCLIVACAAPSYLAKHGAPQRPADLGAHNCLGYSYAALRNEWRFTGPEGVESVRVAGRLNANNGDLLRLAALRGEGIILQPSFIVGDDLAAGSLAPILPGYAPDELVIQAVYPHSRHLSVKVRSFVEFLVARFGQRPEWDRWRSVDGKMKEIS
ncbi:MAG TPA: LysR family transcriptional regulator [Stellaceae bacterium]|nr:LysR family transcriptional regulator [Stellaceae bacterium]